MWKYLTSLAIKRRWIVIAIISAVFLFFLYQSFFIRLSFENKKLIPKDDQAYVDYTNFVKAFGEDVNSVFVSIPIKDNIDDINTLLNRLSNIDGIDTIISLYELPQIYIRNDSLLTKKTIGLKDSNYKLFDYLISKNKSSSILILKCRKDIINSKKRVDFFKKIEDVLKSSSFRESYVLSGLPYIRTVFSKRINRELILFTILSIILSLGFIYVFYRTVVPVISTLIIIFISLVITFGLIPLFGYEITLLTALIPPLIVVIVVQNIIFYYNVFHLEYAKTRNKLVSIIKVNEKSAFASFLTNATTAVGFAVFSFSGSVLLDEFSKVSTVAIMVVYLLMIFLMPLIILFSKAPSQKELAHLDAKGFNNLMKYIAFLVNKRRKMIYVLFGVFTVVCIYYGLKVKELGYIVDDLPEKDKIYTDLKYFEKEYDGVVPLNLVVKLDPNKGLNDFRLLSKVNKLSNKFENDTFFSKPISIVDFLKLINQIKHEDDVRWYRVPTLEDLSEISNLKSSFMLNKSGNGNGLYNDSLLNIIFRIKDNGSIAFKKEIERLKGVAVSVFGDQYGFYITGGSLIVMKGNDYLISNLIQSLVWAFFIISLLVSLLFMSWRMLLISLLPNILPLLFTYGIMGMLDIRLKNSTILIYSIAYGIVVDLTIHFLAKFSLELKKNDFQFGVSVNKTLFEAGYGMAYSTVILFFGFGIFVFSSFGGTIALGLLSSICLIIGLITNILLLPALLLSFSKYFDKKGEFERALISLDDL